MAARHRTRRTVGRGRVRIPLALAVVAGLVLVSGVTIKIVAAGATDCRGSLPLRVAVAPEIEPALHRIGEAWQATQPQVDGECVALSVLGQDPAELASQLTVLAGRAIDVASTPVPTPPAESLPAVWVPDSTAWLGRVRVVDRAAFASGPRSVATSPVVIAMPAAAAAKLRPVARLRLDALAAQLIGGDVVFGVAEPRRDSASLAAMITFGDALATSDDKLPALVKTLRGLVKQPDTQALLDVIGSKAAAGPATEQAVLAHNAAGGPVPLAAVRLDPQLPTLDYPYAIRSGISRSVAQAAAAFREALDTPSAREILARAGFRDSVGVARPGFPDSKAERQFVGSAIDNAEQVQRTLGLWRASNSPSRTLALFDITSSMGQFDQTAATSRAGVMAAAANGGLELFTTDSQVGMWEFAAQPREVLPIETLTPARRAEFGRQLANAQLAPSNRAELYEVLIEAYRVMRDGYDPTRPNIIVVLTDSGDSDPGGLRLERFTQRVQELADPTKPIAVVLIGVGVSPGAASDLVAIAGVLGGTYFPLTKPEQIQSIFLRALLQLDAA